MAILGQIRQRSIFLVLVIGMALFAFVISGVFDGSSNGGAPTDPIAVVNDEDIEVEEAVQFLSLSTALYTLPSSLETNEEDEENNSTEIFFGNSTLVFVLLERDILAVVQLARLHKGESGGGNPHAVRSSIERCHFLFSMFRGGGINFRLHKENTSPYWLMII